MARGIEKRPIFEDDGDRDDFLERLARLAREGALAVLAWALMPNHVHLLVRTANQPLERSMRALLSGYATRFNRRHKRVGHLFQNRYKSVLVQEDRYLWKLVHYIHRNPVPKVVRTVRQLASYPYTGHSAILGVAPREWQDVDGVLAHFGETEVEARRRYQAFIRSTLRLGARDLDGGGLVRSAGGWEYVRELRHGREGFATDERILGGGAFVERALRELNEPPRAPIPHIEEILELVSRALGVRCEGIRAGGRTRAVSRARDGIAYLWTIRLGQSNRRLARQLGLAESSVHEAALRGRRNAEFWNSLLSRDGEIHAKPGSRANSPAASARPSHGDRGSPQAP